MGFVFFLDIDTLSLKVMQKCKGPRIAETTLEEETHLKELYHLTLRLVIKIQ